MFKADKLELLGFGLFRGDDNMSTSFHAWQSSQETEERKGDREILEQLKSMVAPKSYWDMRNLGKQMMQMQINVISLIFLDDGNRVVS